MKRPDYRSLREIYNLMLNLMETLMTFARVRWLLLFVLYNAFVLNAEPVSDSQELFSPQTAYELHKIAYEVYGSESFTEEQAQRAMVFLNGAMTLDESNDYVYPGMLNLSASLTDERYTQLIYYQAAPLSLQNK